MEALTTKPLPKYLLMVRAFAGDSTITSDFDAEIGNAATFLHDNPGVTATVEGHADSSGSEEYNRWLSQQRADAVRQMMIDKHGVDPDRIDAIGLGESRPVMSNDTAEGRNANRRVELVLKGSGA